MTIGVESPASAVLRLLLLEAEAAAGGAGGRMGVVVEDLRPFVLSTIVYPAESPCFSSSASADCELAAADLSAAERAACDCFAEGFLCDEACLLGCAAGAAERAGDAAACAEAAARLSGCACASAAAAATAGCACAPAAAAATAGCTCDQANLHASPRAQLPVSLKSKHTCLG